MEHYENEEKMNNQSKMLLDTDEKPKKMKNEKRGSGLIFFALGVAFTLVIAYIGLAFAIRNKRIMQSLLGSGRSPANGLNYSRIEEKTAVLQSIIDEHFLFDEDISKVEEGIYAGMMNGLGDPYTVYYTEEEYKALNEDTDGRYSGIGAVVSQNPNTKIVTIVTVFDGSPAEEAGLLPGDILYKLDGEEISGEDLDLIVRTRIRGEEGTKLTLTVLRGDDHRQEELEITRRSIEVQTVAARLLDNGIGYIAVSQFDAVTAEQFKAGIEVLQSQGMSKLIVDLRGNPGGLLDQVVDMLDYILPEGLVLYTEDKNGKGDKYYSDGSHKLDMPMAVLVNENSASASEVFTATFKDFKWGKVIGKTTFGKGIVQNVLPLGDGTAIKITTQHYYPPSGYDLHGVGVKPDIEVALDEGAVIGEESDNQLSKAVEILNDWK